MTFGAQPYGDHVTFPVHAAARVLGGSARGALLGVLEVLEVLEVLKVLEVRKAHRLPACLVVAPCQPGGPLDSNLTLCYSLSRRASFPRGIVKEPPAWRCTSITSPSALRISTTARTGCGWRAP